MYPIAVYRRLEWCAGIAAERECTLFDDSMWRNTCHRWCRQNASTWVKYLDKDSKIGNVIVRPTGPDTCDMVMFGHMNFHFPAWVWNHMSSGCLVRNVVKLESYYKRLQGGR